MVYLCDDMSCEGRARKAQYCCYLFWKNRLAGRGIGELVRRVQLEIHQGTFLSGDGTELMAS